MAIMEEAIPLKEWEERERGIFRKRPKTIPRPEPERPKIDNEWKFSDIPIDDVLKFVRADRLTLRNTEGMSFIGYEVTLLMAPNSAIKRKAGRPKESEKDPKNHIGWMDEGEFRQLRRSLGDKVNNGMIHW